MKRNFIMSKAAGVSPFGVFLIVLLVGYGAASAADDVPPPLSARDTTKASTISAGATPFIAVVGLDAIDISTVSRIRYIIAARPDTLSKPVSASFSAAWLTRQGYSSPASRTLKLPVFGLYAGYANLVGITLVFTDGSSRELPVLTVTTAAFSGGSSQVYIGTSFMGTAGNTSLYAKPVIHKPKTGSGLAL